MATQIHETATPTAADARLAPNPSPGSIRSSKPARPISVFVSGAMSSPARGPATRVRGPTPEGHPDGDGSRSCGHSPAPPG